MKLDLSSFSVQPLPAGFLLDLMQNEAGHQEEVCLPLACDAPKVRTGGSKNSPSSPPKG